MPPLPTCDGTCCSNPWRVCRNQRQCAHHQMDEATIKFRDELIAASEVRRDANRVAAA